MTTTIYTIPENDNHVDSDHELEELQEKMNNINEQSAQEFHKLKSQSNKITALLEQNFNENFINKNFDEHELIEEQIDKLIYQYTKIKDNLRNGREVRFYIEKKERQKVNELRYARNVLTHLGIYPVKENE